MKITNVKITNLFGIYNYDLDINTQEPLTILFAKNGRGKTTIMRLIKAVLTVDVLKLNFIEFSEVCITLESGGFVKVSKKNAGSEYEELNQLSSSITRRIVDKFLDVLYNNLVYTIVNQNGHFEKYPLAYPESLAEEDISFSYNNNSGDTSLRDIVSEVSAVYRRRVREKFTERLYRPSEIKVPFSYILKEVSKVENINIEVNPFLLSAIANLCPPKAIKLVESNRLIVDYQDKYETETSLHENILLCAKDMKNKIDEAKKQMEIRSDELDRSFPKDLLSEFKSYDTGLTDTYVEVECIRDGLKEINNKRIRLSEFGLVEKIGVDEYIFDNENIPEQYLPVLNLYSYNTMEKLAVLDDIYERISLFTSFINDQNGLSNKKLQVNAEEGISIVSSYSGKEIPLDKLSSGEKNIIILFYELIFNSNEGSLVFVDEPEISLHIAWQDKYIEQLLKICNRNKMQAIVATHSPDIIGNYDYLLADMLKLEDENDEKE